MQRGAQILRRLLGATSLPTYVFQYIRLRRFIVLHLWRSRALFSDSLWPSVTFLEVVFFRLGALELYFPVCGALLLSLLGVALSCLLTGRVRSGAQSARRHLGAGRFMMAAKKRQKAYKNNGFEHF